jgi:3-hydroxyisobutyrate dehydrogenase
MTNVAFIGLGAMGRRMAGKLLAAGHTLTVYNRDAAQAVPLIERGARGAPSPRAAARGAETIVCMVSDDEAAKAIWLDEATGALAGLAPDAVAVECSTLSVACIEHLERRFADARRAFLAAPVLGSLPQAEARALVALAGGESGALERARPVLSAMAGRIVPLATNAQAAALKLAVNALFSAQVALFAELLGILRTVELEPAAILAAMTDLPTTSPALAGAAALIIKGDDAPRYPIRLVEKDLRYFMRLAPDGASVATAVAHDFARALAKGLGPCNISAIARLFQEGDETEPD